MEPPGVVLPPLATHGSEWAQQQAEVTLNVTLDAAFVPSESQGTRLDFAHVVVLDNFVSDEHRQQLLDLVTQPGWSGAGPPDVKWERETCDGAEFPPTWGLTDAALQALARSTHPAKLELQTRLARLYPDAVISHMPSEVMQPWQAGGGGGDDIEGAPGPLGQEQADAGPRSAGEAAARASSGSTAAGVRRAAAGAGAEGAPGSAGQEQAGTGLRSEGEETAGAPSSGSEAVKARRAAAGAGAEGATGSAGQEQEQADAEGRDPPPRVDANPYVANAAVHGDRFQWHVDADPSDMPESAWTSTHGMYCNREPGKPLLFSLLLYLDAKWPLDHDAETLFLDSSTDTGLMVRPRPRRVVLLDQDVLHRLSVPSAKAGRPRYSLVLKLVMVPKAGQTASLARPEWGAPCAFGSAARAQQAVAQMARERKRARDEAAAAGVEGVEAVAQMARERASERKRARDEAAAAVVEGVEAEAGGCRQQSGGVGG
ncbi:hypothetical protein FOA52_013272 [Chlamydomonas sp. UWO 241]|nr:hypothetical protein FOA52_013272 [Chlamydomonas sp. UWO 241]